MSPSPTKQLPNALYSPKTPVGAIPPTQYPPQPTLHKTITSFLLIVSLSTFHHLLYLPLSLVLSSTATYCAVSYIFLERANPFGSRYGNNREMIKMLLLLVPLQYYYVHGKTPTTTFAYSVGLWIGAHFGFLDSVPSLQSFGMKIVRFPAGVLELTRLEASMGCLLPLFVWYGLVSQVNTKELWSLEMFVLYFSLAAILLGLHCVQNATHLYHGHHWFNMLLVLPIAACLPAGSSNAAVACGLVVGSCIEGIACWGLDPLFHNPLSDDVDFSTTLWTLLVPMLHEQQGEKYAVFLIGLKQMLESVRGYKKNRRDCQWLGAVADVWEQRYACVVRDLTRVHQNSVVVAGQPAWSVRVPVDLKSLVEDLQAKNEECSTLAFVKVVTFGLLAGRETLVKLAAGGDGESGSSTIGALALDVGGGDAFADSLRSMIEQVEKEMTREENRTVRMYEQRILLCLVGEMQESGDAIVVEREILQGGGGGVIKEDKEKH